MRRGTCDPSFGADFKFSAHEDQLVVGNVFVKIYNEQPDFSLEVIMIRHAETFSHELFSFLRAGQPALSRDLIVRHSFLLFQLNQ